MAVALASESKRQKHDGPTPGSSERVEWLKCRRSVVYFVVRYVWIYNATTTDELALCAVAGAADGALREMACALKLLVLKARQLGLSWLVLAYCLHAALFRPPATILLFSKRETKPRNCWGGSRRCMRDCRNGCRRGPCSSRTNRNSC